MHRIYYVMDQSRPNITGISNIDPGKIGYQVNKWTQTMFKTLMLKWRIITRTSPVSPYIIQYFKCRTNDTENIWGELFWKKHNGDNIVTIYHLLRCTIHKPARAHMYICSCDKYLNDKKSDQVTKMSNIKSKARNPYTHRAYILPNCLKAKSIIRVSNTVIGCLIHNNVTNAIQ